MMQFPLLFRLCLLAGLLPAMDGASAAPDYPQRQVHMLVPFPAGGTTDVLGRILAERLAERWRQPVVVENMPGANGIVAAEAASRAPADGYTLLFSPLGPIAVNPLLRRDLPYRAQSFAPLYLAALFPTVLAVRKQLPARDARELIAQARADPERFTYGSQGIGSTSHLTAAMFEMAARVRLRHIPYNGSAPALGDLAGGRIDLFFDNLSSPLPLYRAGRIGILAVAGKRRAPLLPDIPTLDESGLPGFESSAANLLVAPAGLPGVLRRQISEAADAALADTAVRARLLSQGIEPGGGDAAFAAAYVAEQARRWQSVIRAARIGAE